MKHYINFLLPFYNISTEFVIVVWEFILKTDHEVSPLIITLFVSFVSYHSVPGSNTIILINSEFITDGFFPS